MVRVDVGGSVRTVYAQIIPRLQFSTVGNLDGFQRPVVAISLHCLDICDNSEALGDLAKHDVFIIKVRTVDCCYEELGPVGVGAGVGHGELKNNLMLVRKSDGGRYTDQARRLVLQKETLVLKLVAVDALTSSAVRVLEISTLMMMLEVWWTDDQV